MTKEEKKLELLKLWEKLEWIKGRNMDLWKEEGSELCVDELIKEEKEIEDQIRELEKIQIQYKHTK